MDGLATPTYRQRGDCRSRCTCNSRFRLCGLPSRARQSGRETTLPELKPDTFRFLRTEQQTIPPTVVNGRTINTITFGVFAFRYSHSNPLEFLGEFENKKFVTRFTEYRIRKKFTWERLRTGYSFTGVTTSILQPGVE